MRISRIPKLGTVVREGPYLRRADGTELIDCTGIVEETGVPLAVVKSEIEQKYLSGRHFYRHPDCFLVERDAYKRWKRERLAYVQERLNRDGGWPLFNLPPQRSMPAAPVPRPTTTGEAASSTGGLRQVIRRLRRAWAESAADHPHDLP